MPKHANTEHNRTAEVVPRVIPVAPWRVKQVAALDGFRLRVQFVDGTEGIVDMGAFLSSNKTCSTVFEPLRDPSVFAQVTVSLGTVEWPSGADVAPDAMYDEIRTHGEWVIQP